MGLLENDENLCIKDAFDIHKESMEIIASPQFKEGIEIEVEKNRKRIEARPEPKKGFRYKRTATNQLMEEGNYTSEFFLKNAIPVLCKTSALPASQRLPILLVCLSAFDYSRKKIETKNK